MVDKTEYVFKECPCKKTEDLLQNDFTDMCFACGRNNICMLSEDAPTYLKNLPMNYKVLKIENEDGIYVPSFNDSGKELLFLESSDEGNYYVIVPYIEVDGIKNIDYNNAKRYGFMEFNKVFADFYGKRNVPQ